LIDHVVIDHVGIDGVGIDGVLTRRAHLPQCPRSADLLGGAGRSGPVAQLVERRVYTAKVVGSIPAGPT
jgi:hypothetical protein